MSRLYLFCIAGKHRNAIGYSCIDQATSFSAKRDGIKAVTENIRSRSISDQSKESCHESFNSFGKIQSGTESFTERTVCSAINWVPPTSLLFDLIWSQQCLILFVAVSLVRRHLLIVVCSRCSFGPLLMVAC